MKYFLKKLITRIFCATFIFVLLCIPRIYVGAQSQTTLLLQKLPEGVDQQQQFYVDVMFNTNSESVNGIEGHVTFSDTILSFVRAETPASNVTLWIDQPHISGNTITFSGVIPGGFDGQIDPFDPTHKGPGEIMRLVFVAKTSGVASITATDTNVTLNDGTGTLEGVADVTKNIIVSDKVSPSVYTIADTIPPTLSASVVNDENLFDGKYALIFTATDKESGVDRVEVKEENADWTTAESPYLLHNQSKKGILSVRAYDTAGNVATVSLTIPGETISISSALMSLIIALALVLLCILYVIYKKIKEHKKNKSPHA